MLNLKDNNEKKMYIMKRNFSFIVVEITSKNIIIMAYVCQFFL